MSNRKWSLGLIVLVILFGFALFQFISSTVKVDHMVEQLEQGQSAQNAIKHIVLIAQELDNPFWRVMEEGAREAADRFGMKIDYMGPIRINPAEQMKLLERSIAARPDAILVQGISDPDYDLLIADAIDQGIPIITVDADEPGSRRLAYVGIDNRKAGEQLGELVANDNVGQGKIGIIMGSQQADNQQLRLEGFRSAIEASTSLDIIDVRYSNISRIGAAQQTEAMLKQHDDIDIIIGLSALDAPGILEAAKAANREDVLVYGFDDMEQTRQSIAQGSIMATIVQQPREIGAKAIELLDEYFKGGKLSDQYFIGTAVLQSTIREAHADNR